MIGKLRGTIDSVGDDHAVVDVGGVGYLVFASSRVLSQLQTVTGEVSFRIETHVREDHIHLYGFLTESERQWFKLLTTVQGVGSKMALSLLSTLSTDELSDAIAAQDKTMLTRASGVGPRLAERILTELKSKLPTLAGALTMPTLTAVTGGKASKGADDAGQAARSEAISALVNLGYARVDAFSAVARAIQETGEDRVEKIIPLCLRYLAA